jgi:hypothetical protein
MAARGSEFDPLRIFRFQASMRRGGNVLGGREVIEGLGNIDCDEVPRETIFTPSRGVAKKIKVFAAAIRAFLPAATTRQPEKTSVREASRRVLFIAVECRGGPVAELRAWALRRIFRFQASMRRGGNVLRRAGSC